MTRRAWVTAPLILFLVIISRGLFLVLLYGIPVGLDLLYAVGRDKRRRYTPFSITRRWTRILVGHRPRTRLLGSHPVNHSSRQFPVEVKRQIWLRDQGMCRNCGASEYLEYDHVIPWSRGGPSDLSNGQLLCRRCNLAKGAAIS